MYIVITNRKDVVPKIQAIDGIIKYLDELEFMDKVSNDSIDIDEGIYFHTEILDKYLYKSLFDYNRYITYYYFDDESAPTFNMFHNPPKLFKVSESIKVN